MSKFRMLAQKCVATAATAATFGSNTVATLFSQSSNTVATLLFPIVRRISRLKTFFFSRVSSNSSNTFPNFTQEIEKEGFSGYEADEFDHEDYDEWFENWEERYGMTWEDAHERSWTQRAVDEIIEQEKNGTMGDIPF